MSFQVRKIHQVPNSMNGNRTTPVNFAGKLKDVVEGRGWRAGRSNLFFFFFPYRAKEKQVAYERLGI